MTYKQTLFFVGECLSLVKYPERKKKIARLITSGYVDWDMLVKFSSNQMVVPAVYFNLKNAQLLALLPEGLERYFEKITQANRSRNKALLKQANDLAILLQKHQINAIFLKGMAHLIGGLYQDIGERMVGDIDILVAKNRVKETASLIKKGGYYNCLENEELDKPRHYRRLAHKDYIASVEIHWDILEEGHKHDLNYETLFDNKQKQGSFYLPSFEHQALHNTLNAQVNDHSYKRGLILVRQLYDCFLLSFYPNVQNALKDYNQDYFLKNIYFKWLHKLFKAEFILYKKTLFLNVLMWRYLLMTDKTLYIISTNIFYFCNRFYNYPRQMVLAFNNKSKRQNIIKHLTTKGWLKKHLQSYKKGRLSRFK
ncbi:MAG: nucleotidyltransferase family protein [Flavobacteriaceae bacterium]|nr:nucleotidyltransferase family protein [Flavobacteriaceae bacterium]